MLVFAQFMHTFALHVIYVTESQTSRRYLHLIVYSIMVFWSFLSFFTITTTAVTIYAIYLCKTSTLQLSHLMTKPTKWHMRSAKAQISLGIRPVWSESSLSAWWKLGPLATHWTHSKDSDQTGQMPRLIWVLAGRTVILFGLSWGGSIL